MGGISGRGILWGTTQRVSSKDPLFDGEPTNDLLVDELIDSFLGHSAVPITLRVDDQYRSSLADPQALNFGAVAGSRTR